MNPTQTRSGGAGFPSHGAEPCVWMSAGLVDYKLCDLAFECDRCPFDVVMRGQSTADRTADRLASRVAVDPTRFPDDRRYHPKHTWAQAARSGAPGRLRVGLDAFAAWLIGDATSAVLPLPGADLARGRAGGWLVVESAALPLAMPASGSVVRPNDLLRANPRLAVEEPYDAGWLVEIACADADAALAALDASDRMKERAAGQAREFRAEAAASLRRGAERVGVTLADGGERLTTLREMLGPWRYRALIDRYLV